MAKKHLSLKDTITRKIFSFSTKADTLTEDLDIILPGKSGELLLRENLVIMADSNDIDISSGKLFVKTITGPTTITISNPEVEGVVSSFILEITNPGSSVTWFSGIKWAGGTVPALSVTGTDILGFYSYDAGVTWRGMLLSKDSK